MFWLAELGQGSLLSPFYFVYIHLRIPIHFIPCFKFQNEKKIQFNPP